jgi:hypothetical protein
MRAISWMLVGRFRAECLAWLRLMQGVQVLAACTEPQHQPLADRHRQRHEPRLAALHRDELERLDRALRARRHRTLGGRPCRAAWSASPRHGSTDEALADVGDVDVHMGTASDGRGRRRLERLCRYFARRRSARTHELGTASSCDLAWPCVGGRASAGARGRDGVAASSSSETARGSRFDPPCHAATISSGSITTHQRSRA